MRRFVAILLLYGSVVSLCEGLWPGVFRSTPEMMALCVGGLWIVTDK